MSERTSFAPGTFSWSELVTSDGDAAKAFYTALFGWEYEDSPIGEGQVYSMALLGGRYAGALYQSSDQPPHWNCYVTVGDVDEVASRAGDVVAEPFDVMSSGRMAVIRDPTGAILHLWQPRDHIGAGVVNADGALTWNDLTTPDPETAARYYGDLLGWTTIDVGEGYRVIRNGERSNGGMLRHDGPAAWTPYFGCHDLDATLAQVGELGGRILNGPLAVPNGRVAVVADPQGAVFCVLTGDYDD
jgi:predicted enzyme related to lactoylglutathione lyase